ESAVASLGIALAAIILAAVASLGWWTLRTQREALEQSRAREIQAIGAILCQSAETMLESNELSALRRLVAVAGREHKFEMCRITLPDGQIVADASPARITAHKLPATWTTPAGAVATPKLEKLSAVLPINVLGRGPASLEISAAAPDLWWLYVGTQTGVGS